MEELRTLVDDHAMAMNDLDKATFLLAATDLHRLQQAMADAQAARAQQVALLKDALADGRGCWIACLRCFWVGAGLSWAAFAFTWSSTVHGWRV